MGGIEGTYFVPKQTDGCTWWGVWPAARAPAFLPLLGMSQLLSFVLNVISEHL